jgi:hypothetical protein
MRPTQQLLWQADPVAFAADALHFQCDNWQANMLRSSKDGLLLLHRGAGKSTITSIAALHLAKFRPGSQTLILGPSGRQAQILFQSVRRFLKMLEPTEVLETDNRLSCELQNGSMITALPGASPDTIRGYHPDLIIEDESARVMDSVHEACAPMLLVTKGRHLLLTTPNGARGHFWMHWHSGNPDWERFELAVYDNPRMDKSQVEKIRRKTPEWMWNQEYLLHWQSGVDQIFPDELVQAALDPAVRPLFTKEALAELMAT